MRFLRLIVMLVSCAFAAHAQERAITIHADRLFDGKGSVQKDVTLTVRGGKIESITQGKPVAAATYHLPDATLLPGLIDTHAHLAWHFGPDGRFAQRDSGPAQSMGYALENAYVTLLAGFTTVQNLGNRIDRDVREAIARGVLPGPRIITSLEPITDEKLTPEQIREAVRKLKADGADLIKIFATKSIRNGGGRSLSREQIFAACEEAHALGLRVAVHAHAADAIRDAVEAGCTSIEHGTFADDATLQFIASRGVYFDPNIHLVLQNYLDNRAKYQGIGNYDDAGFAAMEEALPLNLELFKRALKVKGLKIVFGTDAVAGAHGRNVEELIYRVQKGGQSPRDALISITSLAAESLRLGDTVGALVPGMDADVIAVAGNPLDDITALRRVIFVMRGGQVFKSEAAK